MIYVGSSRAKVSATVYTDDRAKMMAGINEHAGLAQMVIAASPEGAKVAGNIMGAKLN